MRAPAFWWRKAGAAAAALAPLAALYGAVAASRLRRGGAAVGCPVVCIGDLTVGGGGKTPAALAAARLLEDAGEQPVFLTRGYGGRLPGPLVMQPGVHRAGDVGDEPLLLARAHPTVVARERAAGARLARARGASVIVMDDGFQNPALAKDCAVLAVDAARGIGNGYVLPAGPLRAPLAAQLARAHAVLAIGEGAAADPVLQAARDTGLAVFRGRLEPSAKALAALRDRPLLAFAGIGHPEKFFATLQTAGLDVRARRAFPDHHPYTAADARRLLGEAEAQGLTLVTTEKDFVRVDADGAVAELAQRASALPVSLVIADETTFAAFLRGRIRSRA
jgi:tetraacyldisaccharide 4'-kinase